MFDATTSLLLVRLFWVLSFFVAIFFGVFLYWRAGRHELLENQVLFDIVAIFGLGTFVGGRLVDFVARPEFYSWSVTKLIFFNAFWGFDIYGAFLGGVLFVWFYLRKKKEKFWEIFDFASEGLSFGIFVFLFLTFLSRFVENREILFKSLLPSICFLILFWVIKRLAKQKKHRGYFASLFLVVSIVINLLISFMKVQKFGWNLIWPELFLVVAMLIVAVNWYLLAKRKVSEDIKNSFGLLLLSIFKLKRVATNIKEADNSAKAIVLSPYYLVKGAYFLVKYIVREIAQSFFDLKRSFGFRK